MLSWKTTGANLLVAIVGTGAAFVVCTIGTGLDSVSLVRTLTDSLFGTFVAFLGLGTTIYALSRQWLFKVSTPKPSRVPADQAGPDRTPRRDSCLEVSRGDEMR